MNTGFDLDKVKELLARFAIQAEELVKDPSKVEELLQQLEEKLNTIPAVGEGLSKVPLMISMIRAYITKEYTEVSPKVVASMLCAVLYLVKGRDIIRDDIPVVGLVDDIAVAGAAFMLSEKELDAYAAWREAKEGTVTAERALPQTEDVSEALEAQMDEIPTEA
ncbi:MAG: DUF1232 domain-containing protein [Firmicutes bacterium]|nr:DUF1232 domain-containing protein [Bacillota bacterium]